MKPQAIIKRAIDLAMTVLLLLLMAYHITGEAAHEWIGACILTLFIAHNLLNRGWYAALFKGRYAPYRILLTTVNLLLLLSMLVQMVSGILLSRYVFDFLPVSGYASFARKLHLLGAYWGFPLLSIHLGLHWSMLIGMVRKALKSLKITRTGTAVLRIAAVLIALYGAAAFLRYDLFSYMTFQNQFVFFDYEQSVWSFFGDYLAIMGLWIFAAHYMASLARRHTGFCKSKGRIVGETTPREN